MAYISKMVDVKKEDMKKYDENNMIVLETDEDKDAVYDLTSSGLFKEEGYHRIVPTEGRFGIINKEFPINGAEPTEEEFGDICSQYGLFTRDGLIKKQTPEGENVYVRLTKTLLEFDEFDAVFCGATILRFENGKAQGIYYTLYNPEEEAMDYVDYIVQSLEFTE